MEFKPSKKGLLVAAGLLLALGAGVGLRVAYAVKHAEELQGDEEVYDRLGRQLDEHGYLGYGPDRLRSWRPPLYPAFVAGTYRILGDRPLNVKLVQAALSGLTIWIVFLLGRRMGSDTAGVAGALFFALAGFEIRHSAGLHPATVLALLLAFFALIGLREPTLRRLLAQALIAGLVLHLQPGLGIVVALWTIWILVRKWELRSLGIAAAFVIATLICLLPWTFRNYRIHGEVVYVSTNGGLNLLKGNNPEATSLPAPASYLESVRSEMPPELSEVESDRWYRGRALSFMSDNPGRYLVLALARAVEWTVPAHVIEPGSGWPVTFGVVFPFAILGSVYVLYRRRTVSQILILVSAIAAPSILVGYPGPWFRAPAMPLLAALAGVGLAALVGWTARLIRRRRVPAAQA